MKLARRIRRQAYAEAAALLEADMSSADLQCDQVSSGFTEKEAEQVREYIRTVIVGVLEQLKDVQK